MDCYFHSNVPSIAPCADCGKAICATCRDDRGTCPSCRLAEKIEAKAGPRPFLEGQVPPRRNAYREQSTTPPPPPSAPQTQPRATVTTIASDDPVESRALVALGYPLWPLALLGLLDRKGSRYLKKQALQALGFNVGMAAFWGLLELATQIPLLGISAWVIIPFMIPIFLVASVYFGIKVWHGEDVRVPVIGDWIEERLPA
jgi:uncharacterized membrane protein